jgi:hypothetical protein
MGMLDDFRSKNPAYAQVPDAKLADGLYKKFYAGKMDRSQFDSKVGLAAPAPAQTSPVPVGPAPDPAVTGSPKDAIGQGLTLGFADEMSGGLYGLGALLRGEEFGPAYEQQRDLKREQYKAYAEENPGSSMGLELLSGLATGGLGAGAAAAKGGMTVAKAAGVGGAVGGVQGAGTSEEEDVGGLAVDTAQGAALGAGTGAALQGAGKMVGDASSYLFGGAGRARTPTEQFKQAGEELAEGLDPSKYKRQVDTLQKAGVDLTAGQRSGNVPLKTLDETVAPTLLGGGVRSTLEDQQTQLQRKLMQRAGFNPRDLREGVVDDEVISRAKLRFSNRYAEALSGKTVNLAEDRVIDRLAEVEARHADLLEFEQAPKLRRAIDNLLDKATREPLTGEGYQRLRSNLGRRSKNARMTDPAVADLYKDLQRTLDDAFLEGVDGTTASAKKGIDREYRNFKAIEKVAKQGGQGVSAGTLPLASLNRAAEFATDDFKELARAGSAVFGSGTPNSGTASRVLGLTEGGIGQVMRGGIIAGQTLGLGRGASPAATRAGGALTTALAPTLSGIAEREQQMQERKETLAEMLAQNPAVAQSPYARSQLGLRTVRSSRNI